MSDVVTQAPNDGIRPCGVHKWIDCDEKEEKVNSAYDGARYAIVVLGKTGVGKSSLIKTMTSNQTIRVSGGSDSCTKNMGFYLDRNNILWIDTVGGMDVNQDSEILFRLIKQQCFKNNINKIKLIWCVDSNQRTDSEYLIQARSGLIDSVFLFFAVIVVLNAMCGL